MQPALEYLPRTAGESFVSRYFDYSYFPTPWHFHPEYEIVMVTESTGKRFIGNQINRFEPGDLVLLGPYLPHTYQNDKSYYEEQNELRAKSIVVHFRADSFGDGFLSLPETQRINTLLKNSSRGVAVKGHTNTIIGQKLYELLESKGFAKWLRLAEILEILSVSKEQEYICNQSFVGQNTKETIRMNTIINFVVTNFRQEIEVTKVAALTGMSATSFSRYFSNRTRKPFTAFVNEVRLNHISKLLIETDMSVTDIWLDSGFNNLSNFNRQFKSKYHYNPVMFRKQYQNQHLR